MRWPSRDRRRQNLTQNLGLVTGILSTPQTKPARGQGDVTRHVTFQHLLSEAPMDARLSRGCHRNESSPEAPRGPGSDFQPSLNTASALRARCL